MKLCVYCGSSSGHSPDYEKLARSLAQAMLQRGIDLVYGGASVGLMGIMANSILDGGGRVTGIIPKHLPDGICHTRLTELHLVNSMHERKTAMFELSDGFIALPGGFGTIEELTEMLTWAQLGLHQFPCGILHCRGYFDLFVQFLDNAVTEGFLQVHHRKMLIVSTDADELLENFSNYVSPKPGK